MVRIDRGMARTAFQRFHIFGPIALLPIWNNDNRDRDDHNGNKIDAPTYANIVRSTTHSHAKTLLVLDEFTFLQQLNAKLQS